MSPRTGQGRVQMGPGGGLDGSRLRLQWIEASDVWQGTSGTSRDVPAVGLESLSGLEMCREKKNLKKGKREREREREKD